MGYATVLNLSSVFASGGFEDLGAGVLRIVITVLAHASVGGLVGYFMARDRFDNKPSGWMALGLLLAATVNGVFSVLRGEISESRIAIDASGAASAGFSGLPALLLSAAVAIVIFAIVFMLMRRVSALPKQTAGPAHDTKTLYAALAVAALAVLLGLLYRNSMESRTREYADAASGVTLVYPDSWRLDKRDAGDGVLRVRDPQQTGYATTLELRWVAIEATADDKNAIASTANSLAVERAQQLSAYKTLDLSVTSDTPGAGSASYAFVSSGGALQERVPTVVLGEDRYVRRGDKVFIYTLHSTEANLATAQPLFERFISTSR